jgi:hypothetical protein
MPDRALVDPSLQWGIPNEAGQFDSECGFPSPMPPIADLQQIDRLP